MILEEKQKVTMAERVKSFAKVRVPGVKEGEKDYVLDVITDIINYIEFFNSIGEYAVQALDVPLEDIPILNEFKDFVIPKSVKINSADLDCIEMLKLPDIEESKVANYSFAYYLNRIQDFRALFRADISNNVVRLSDLRKALSWSEMRDLACYEFETDDGSKEYFVHQSNVPFVPIKLVPLMAGTMKARYFNMSLSEMMDDYIERWLI